MSKIITVSREFGSGGRELGKRLADELGIAYFDKEILERSPRRPTPANGMQKRSWIGEFSRDIPCISATVFPTIRRWPSRRSA